MFGRKKDRKLEETLEKLSQQFQSIEIELVRLSKALTFPETMNKRIIKRWRIVLGLQNKSNPNKKEKEDKKSGKSN